MAKSKKQKAGGINGYKLLIYLVLGGFAFFLYHCRGTKISSAEHIDKLEIPAMSSAASGLTIAREGYTLSYNRESLLPNWVAYELTSLETEGDEPRAKHFTKDPDI